MEYLTQYETYNKKVVFVCDCNTIENFNKYYYYLLLLCIHNKVRLYYLMGTPFDHLVHHTFHISVIEHEMYLYSIHHLSSMLDGVLYVVKPQIMYNLDIPIYINDLCVPYMRNTS